jgi:hypothetical protein
MNFTSSKLNSKILSMNISDSTKLNNFDNILESLNKKLYKSFNENKVRPHKSKTQKLYISKPGI